MSNVSVSKRGNYWQYRFYTVVSQGSRKQISKSGFRTKKEALEAGNTALAKYLSSGFTNSIPDYSVADFLELWFEKAALPYLRPTTLKEYRTIINQHLKPKFGHYYLKDLSSSTILDYVLQLKVKGYAKNTVSGIIGVLSDVFEYAIEHVGLSKNPCKGLRYPEFPPAEERSILTPEQFERIIERFPEGSYWHIPLMIGYHTGMRSGEIFGLTWEDVDFEAKKLYVRRKIVNVQLDPNNINNRKGTESTVTCWCFGPTKTKTSEREILLDSVLLDLLQREKKRQEQNRQRLGQKYIVTYVLKSMDGRGNILHKLVSLSQEIPVFLPEADLVCKRDNGKFLTKNAFKYCTNIIQYELGIKFSTHNLRHTHATILVQEGANIKDVQERLGHARISTTMDTYVHNTPKIKRDSVALFEKFLKKHKVSTV